MEIEEQQDWITAGIRCPKCKSDSLTIHPNISFSSSGKFILYISCETCLSSGSQELDAKEVYENMSEKLRNQPISYRYNYNTS